MTGLTECWEIFAEENNLNVDDTVLRKTFTYAWHSAANECSSFLEIKGYFGLSNLMQDYMRDKEWDYDGEEDGD